MAASTYLAQVQQLYIAYFGRPADTIGLNYWAGIIDAAGGNIAAVQAGFSASAESQALFGNKSTVDKVTAIYQNAFGRAPEPAGLAYWVAQLDSGKVTQAQASWTIQQSAGAGDAAAVQNKLTAAQAFTAQIDTTAEIVGYQGTAAAASARAFLATVTADNATATAAVNGAAAALNTAVVASTNSSGTVFTLTANADNLVGTSGNDVFNGVVVDNSATGTTLNAFDTIDGGAGTADKLAIVATGTAAATIAPITTNVEVLSVRNLNTGGVTANVAGMTGLTQVVSDSSVAAVTFTGVASNAAVTVQNTNANATVTYNNNTFAAATTTPQVNVSAAGTTTARSTITLNDAGTVAATNLAVKADGTNAITLAGTALAQVKNVTVTGTGSLDVVAPSTNVTKVDASALIGGLTYTNLATTATTILGGLGNDVITIGAALATASSITLGAGNDAIKNGGFAVAAGSVIDGGAGVDTFDLSLVNVANASSFVNFEVASLDTLATATYDIDLLSAKNTITGLSLTAGSTNTATVQNVASGTTLTVNGGTTTGLTLIEKGAAASATDSLNITFGAKAAASVTAVLNDVETVNIVSGGTAGVANTLVLNGNSFTQATSSAAAVTEKFVITGANALSLTVTANGTGATTNNSANTKITIDGSAATGKLTITGDAKTTSIITGTGDDLITLGAAATTVATGTGKDVVDVTLAVGTTTFTTIAAGGISAGDSIITGAAAAGTAAKIGAATSLAGATDVTSIASALNAVADAAGTVSHVAWGVVGSDVYVLLDTVPGTTGTGVAANNLIKVTGVTDISNWTSDGAGHVVVA